MTPYNLLTATRLTGISRVFITANIFVKPFAVRERRHFKMLVVSHLSMRYIVFWSMLQIISETTTIFATTASTDESNSGSAASGNVTPFLPSKVSYMQHII